MEWKLILSAKHWYSYLPVKNYRILFLQYKMTSIVSATSDSDKSETGVGMENPKFENRNPKPEWERKIRNSKSETGTEADQSVVFGALFLGYVSNFVLSSWGLIRI